jgi:hypothetical protein
MVASGKQRFSREFWLSLAMTTVATVGAIVIAIDPAQRLLLALFAVQGAMGMVRATADQRPPTSDRNTLPRMPWTGYPGAVRCWGS